MDSLHTPVQGFHKILKKHDKELPHAPCQQFYVAHLHHQPWVQARALLCQKYRSLDPLVGLVRAPAACCHPLFSHSRSDLGCSRAGQMAEQ